MNAMLRLAMPEDLPALMWVFRHPSSMQFLGGARDEARALSSANELIAPGRYLPAWVLVPTAHGEVVGFVSLDYHHDGGDVEVSFVLLPEFQGRGLARAAVAAALAHAWQLGLPRVVAETQAANARSVRLLAALGFTAQCELERFGAAQTLYVIARPCVASDDSPAH